MCGVRWSGWEWMKREEDEKEGNEKRNLQVEEIIRGVRELLKIPVKLYTNLPITIVLYLNLPDGDSATIG
jgi:hypothetical protein